jgi:hypothetical protein
MDTCEVCERTGDAAKVCRFEVACLCWYGVPCDGSGRGHVQERKAAKRAAKAAKAEAAAVRS